MVNSRDFFFDKTDLFNRIRKLEILIGLDSDFDFNELNTKLNNIEQTLNTINGTYATRTYIDNRLIEKVNKIGDSLLGNLSLLVEPFEDNHVINKKYLDAIMANINALDLALLATKDYVNTQCANRVSKFGDFMYGELILANDAIRPLHPVSKQQLDLLTNSVVITGNLDW
jgi:hypothetical protein